MASKIMDLESFKGLDQESCPEISKYSLGKQNNGSGILCKVLINKSQKLAKVLKYWAISQHFGQTPKILGNLPKIGQSPKNWQRFQNIG